MIRFDNVSFGYSKNDITIHQLNFEIEKGEFVALAGENGAGKSTTSKLINGLLKPVSGDVTVMGLNTRTTKTSRIAKHVGFLFQNPDRQLCRNTVREELLFGLDLVTELNKEEKNKRVETILAKLELDGDSDPFRLSRGERQRVALASLLVVEPEILILDEPTRGIDIGAKAEIHKLISDIARQGVAVILISSEMPELIGCADRVAVLREGVMTALLERGELEQDRIMSHAAQH